MANISFNGPEFQNLSAEKLHFLKELSQDIEQMPSKNSLNYLLTLTTKLKSSNIKFTDSEMNLIQHILTSQMAPKEKEKFTLLKKLISNK